MGRISKFLLATMIVAGCGPRPMQAKPIQHRWTVMGTFFEITWFEKTPKDVSDKMFEKIKLVDEKVSVYKDSSDLSVLNSKSGLNTWTHVDPITVDLLKTSIEARKQTNGYFDIGVGSLVQLWKLNLPLQGASMALPDQQAQEKIHAVVKSTQIEIDSLNVRLSPKKAFLDMGGIAKGYALDLAKQAYSGESCGLMNLGRQILMVGTCSAPLRFGIQDPMNSEKVVAVVELRNGSLATTGSYERFFTYQNKKIGHILHPKLGRPVQSDLVSVTVWAKEATTADIWSTALYVAGFEEGMKMINSKKLDIGTVWIFNDEKVKYFNSSSGQMVFTQDLK